MADKLINTIIGKITGKKPGGSNPDAASLLEAKKELADFNKQMDDASEAIMIAKQNLRELGVEMKKMVRDGEDEIKIKKLQRQLDEEQRELDKEKQRAERLNLTRAEKINELAKKNNQDPKTFKAAVDAFDELSDSVGDGTSKLSAQRQMLNSVTNSLGMNTDSLLKLGTQAAVMLTIFDAAARQVVRLNSEMITFQRTMSGALNAKALGFDNYGSNSSFGRTGSVDAFAGQNNLQLSELLATFQAFSDGQVIGLTNNLQQSQEELLKYGVAVGKVSKLYGVQQGTLNNLTKSLTQDYGVNIVKVTETIQHGADVAAAAGVNINNFFHNMEQIAGLTGALFVRGGAAGMEKAALTLSKLGLSASALERVSSSITDFGSLVERQNKAATLGLSNFSAAQARIFAKSQTGDSQGALRLQQSSLAKDIAARYTDSTGSVNAQGLLALQQMGVQKEEIAGIQRLIKAQKSLGVSFDDVIKETNLTTAQLAQKRGIEQENMTMLEKVGVLWSTIKSSFVDPIAAVLGPLLDIVIDSFIILFKILGAVLKPVIHGFEILGMGLNWIAKQFNTAGNYITAFLDKIGLGAGGGGVLSKLVDVIGGLVAVILAYKAFAMAKWAWEKTKAVASGIGSTISDAAQYLPGKMGRLGKVFSAGKGGLLKTLSGGFGIRGLAGGARNLVSGGGGNLLKSLGPKLLKGVGVGALASIGGGLIGDSIGGKSGNTVSSIASGAGTGAVIGSIIPVIGTAIGAAIGGVVGLVSASWDEIDSIWSDNSTGLFTKIWSTLKTLAGNLWDATKSFGSWIWDKGKWAISPFAAATELVLKQAKASETKDNVRIASQAGGLGANATEQLAVLRKSKGPSATEIMEAQEKKMNETFGAKPQKQIIQIQQRDLLGGYKVKATGM